MKCREPEKIERMTNFECLNFQGKVNLKNFKWKYWVIENYDHKDDADKRGEKQKLMRIFFAREIMMRPRGKKFHKIYELTKRIFLGPTTTDNDLAFLMVFNLYCFFKLVFNITRLIKVLLIKTILFMILLLELVAY